MSEKELIVVIDDEEVIRISCRQILEKEGYEVQCFADSETGLAAVIDVEKPPHLVLTDLKMPGLSGIDIIKRVKEKRPEVVTVVITGYATIESAVEAVRSGAYDYLPKPFTPEELRSVVKRAIEKRKLDLEPVPIRTEAEKTPWNFITTVSHDLRSPLAAVCQNFDVILGEMAGPVDPRQRDILLKARSRLENLISVTSDWLSLARIEAGDVGRRIEKTDLPALLAGCIESMKLEAGNKGVAMTLSVEGAAPAVMCDHRALAEAIGNVIGNAIKYNRRNGKVGVTVRPEESGVRVDVEDTGVGIAEKDLPFIFNEFYRVYHADQPFSIGTGLGLTIAKRAIEAHSGTIKVESRPGEGSKFSIFLPSLLDEAAARMPSVILAPQQAVPPSRKTVSTVCTYCSCGCGLYITADRNNQAITQVMPSRSHPVSAGTLCFRGWRVNEFIQSAARVRKPLVRKGSDFAESTWDVSMTLAAKRLREVRDAHGGAAIGIIYSAKCTNEDVYLLHKLGLAALRTNNIDGSMRLYQTGCLPYIEEKTGLPAGIGSIDDLQHAENILIFGADLTTQQPQLGSMVLKAARGGAKVAVVDPRKTQLARLTEHVAVKAGTDLALVNGLAAIIMKEGLADKPFVSKCVSGYDELAASLAEVNLDETAKRTGVPRQKIEELARRCAKSRTVIVVGPGLAQHPAGTDGIVGLCNLAALTGNAGRKGAGLLILPEQNNALGCLDMAGVTAAGMRERVRKAWGADPPAGQGLTLLEMIQAAAAGKIKALYVAGGNLISACPDSGFVRAALGNLEFLVVSELFLTETAQMAHVVLPAASFAEKDGTFTNFERRVQRVRRAIEPLGEARPDWRIAADLSNRLGFRMGYETPAQVMEEIAKVVPGYGKATAAALEKHGGVVLEGRPVENLRLVPVSFTAAEPDLKFPFTLSVGRVHHHWNSGSMTRRSFSSQRESPASFVRINPNDAGRLKVRDGWMVRVKTRKGEMVFTCVVDPSVPENLCFVPIFSGDKSANVLTEFRYDKDCKIAAIKDQAAKIEVAS